MTEQTNTQDTPATFREACRQLRAVFSWWIMPKQWINRRIYYYGKMRTVTAETFDCVKLTGLPYPVAKEHTYINVKK